MSDPPASCPFVPPFPSPHARKSSLLMRFLRGWRSWLEVAFDKSYTMFMGEVRMPGLHLYIANELSLVRRIMDGAKEFPKHRMLLKSLDPVVGNSAFTANGDDWEHQRAMINPVFQHTALAKTLSMMRDASSDLIARIEAMDLSKPIDVDPLTTQVAADIIFRTIFSVTLDPAGADIIHRTFSRFQRHAQSASMLRLYGLPVLHFDRKAEAAAADIHAVFAPIVRDRYDRYHQHGDVVHRDILQGMLEARHPVTGKPFTFTGVMEQVSLIFLAGHETSASLMSWALYLMAECPHVQTAVRDEANGYAEDNVLTLESLRKMSHVRNVVRETLRLYPPVSFLPREVMQPTQMRSKKMKPGAMLLVSPWLIQRNENHWTCPHSFDPDRFEGAEGQAGLRDAWLPFGKGPRVCVGAGFATQEAMVVLAMMAMRFRISSPADDKPFPISRLTLRPRDGVRLMLEPIA